MLIWIGFLSAFVRFDWPFCVDFHDGIAAFAGGVRFLLSVLVDGAISSDLVEELSSLSEQLVTFISRVVRCDVSLFSSICRLIPRVDCSL